MGDEKLKAIGPVVKIKSDLAGAAREKTIGDMANEILGLKEQVKELSQLNSEHAFYDVEVKEAIKRREEIHKEEKEKLTTLIRENKIGSDAVIRYLQGQLDSRDY